MTKSAFFANPLSRGLAWARARVALRTDTEFQQSLIRLVFGVGYLVYFGLGIAPVDDPALRAHLLFVVAPIIVAIGLGVTLATLIWVRPSPTRRVLTILNDYAQASYIMAISGPAGGLFIVVYLWVAQGNGTRFGPRYLALATACSVLGFATVMWYSPYWQENLAVAWALMLTMVLVPAYSALLVSRLHRALADAQAANRAKSEFLANVSHELRTPLNGVIGMTELLKDTVLSQDQVAPVRTIQASAQALLGLIEDVLDVSRIEAGRVELEPVDYAPSALLQTVAAVLAPQASSNGVQFLTHVDPALPALAHGSEKHVRQILLNLAGNAVKFTESGSVVVWAQPGAQGFVRYNVTDTGIGIAESARATIFGSFVQADTSITRKYGGTGLGTTIAKKLAEALGGSIGVESVLGQGSTFWVDLPLRPAVKRMTGGHGGRVPLVALAASAELAAQLAQDLHTEGLRANRLHGAICQDGLAALRQKPDLLLIAEAYLSKDLEACAASIRLAGLPAVLLTQGAGPTPSALLRAVRAGFTVVLPETAAPDELARAVRLATAAEPRRHADQVGQGPALDGAASRPGTSRCLNILVAEDNRTNLMVIKGLLEKEGHRVTLTVDGEQGLDALQSPPPGGFDLAIFDMQMPVMSGPEAVMAWRFLDPGRLPIIMLTADARKEASEISLAAGADRFLTKPLNRARLLEVIRELVPDVGPIAIPDVPPVNAQSEAPAATPVLDAQALADVAGLGGGVEFIRDMADCFAQEGAQALASATTAQLIGDFTAWKREVHKLKGGASDIAGARLAEACRRSETIRPLTLDGPAGRAVLSELSTEFGLALLALREHIQNSGLAWAPPDPVSHQVTAAAALVAPAARPPCPPALENVFVPSYLLPPPLVRGNLETSL